MSFSDGPQALARPQALGPRAAIVVVGNFDGVHIGHQAVLREAERRAIARGIASTMLTFSPHPASALGRPAPAMLSKLARKIELAKRAAPSMNVVVQTFDLAFAARSPRDFADEILARQLDAAEVVVGRNFRFGNKRAGDFEALARLGEELGFATNSHALLADAKGAISSTRVREALAAGDVDEATRLLGRPHMVSGVVVKGDQRGRTIGFPTCNLGDVEEAMPGDGVYAVLVDRELEGGARALAKGVANIGVRPTVKEAGAKPTLEVNLFDVDEDLYGAALRVHVVARIRDEQRFSGLDALKAQIARDADAARARLEASAPNDGAFG